MLKFKNVIALLLVIVMVLGLVACDSNPAETTKATEQTTKATETNATETKDTTPAEREPVVLKLYNYYNKEYVGWEETAEAINKYLEEKLNTTIEWHMCLVADYNSNVSTLINAGGDFDIVFTRPGIVDFASFAKAGAFLPIEDYVDEYLPGSQALLQENAFNAMKIDGHQYGIPLARDSARNFNIQVNMTMLKDLGLTVPEYKNFLELTDWIYEAKAVRDKKYPEKADQTFLRHFSDDISSYYTADYLLGQTVALNIDGVNGFKDQGDDAFCVYMTDEYRELAKLRYQMVKDNIIPFDEDSFDTEGVLFKAGEFLFDWSQGTVFVDEEANMPHFMTGLYRAKDGVIATNGYQMGYAVSAKCEYPERALEVIEMLNTDPYVATMLHFGPENIGWTDKDNDGVIEAGPANDVASGDKYYWYWYGWNLGGLTTSKLPTGYPDNFTELLNEMNNSAYMSPVMGFTFNAEPVENEIAACNNVIAEYNSTILSGQNDDVDKLVDEFVQKLKDNGIEKIVDEMNSQIDAWRATN